MEEFDSFVSEVLGYKLKNELISGKLDILVQLYERFDLHGEQIESILEAVKKTHLNTFHGNEHLDETLTENIRKIGELTGFNVLKYSGLYDSVAKLLGFGKEQTYILSFILLYFLYSRKGEYDILCQSVRQQFTNQIITRSDKDDPSQLLYLVSELFSVEVDLCSVAGVYFTTQRFQPIHLGKKEVLFILEWVKDGSISYHPLVMEAYHDQEKIQSNSVLMEPRIYNFSKADPVKVEYLGLQNPMGNSSKLFMQEATRNCVLNFIPSKYHFNGGLSVLDLKRCLEKVDLKLSKVDHFQLNKVRKGTYIIKRSTDTTSSMELTADGPKDQKILSFTESLEESMETEDNVQYSFPTFTFETDQFPSLGKTIKACCSGVISNKSNSILGFNGSLVPLRIGHLHSNQVIFNHGPGIVEVRLIGREWAFKLAQLWKEFIPNSADGMECGNQIYLSRSVLEDMKVSSQLIKLSNHHMIVSSAGTLVQLVFGGSSIVSLREIPLEDVTRLAIFKKQFHSCKTCEIEGFTHENLCALIEKAEERKRQATVEQPINEDEDTQYTFDIPTTLEGIAVDEALDLSKTATKGTLERIGESLLEEPLQDLQEDSVDPIDQHENVGGGIRSGHDETDIFRRDGAEVSTEVGILEGTPNMKDDTIYAMFMGKPINAKARSKRPVTIKSYMPTRRSTRVTSRKLHTKKTRALDCPQEPFNISEVNQETSLEIQSGMDIFASVVNTLNRSPRRTQTKKRLESKEAPQKGLDLNQSTSANNALEKRQSENCPEPIHTLRFLKIKPRKPVIVSTQEKAQSNVYSSNTPVATTSCFAQTSSDELLTSHSVQHAITSSDRVLRKRPERVLKQVAVVRRKRSLRRKSVIKAGSRTGDRVVKRQRKHTRRKGKFLCGRDPGSNGIGHNDPECRKRFTMKQHLTRHYKRVQNGKRFKCTEEGCQKAFYENSDLRTHIRVVHKKLKWKCSYCDNKYNYRKDLVAHITSKHPGKTLPPPKKRGTILINDLAVVMRTN